MLDQEAATELQIFIENDNHIHMSRFIPVMKNLQRKVKKGTYNHSKAPELWRYLVDAAAKSYDKKDTSWYITFNTTTRQHVAQSLADEYRIAVEDIY